MALVRKQSIKMPRPKAKAAGLSLFSRVTPPGSGTGGGKAYKKSDLQEDPMKFGNFGYDVNQLTPSTVQRARSAGKVR